MYQQWIAQHYPTPESAERKCACATTKMQAAFPELIRVRGHAWVDCGPRPHWWCKTSDGQVVDPTAHQWKSIAFYEELPDGPEPHGKCLECGALLYRPEDESYRCRNCKEL